MSAKESGGDFRFEDDKPLSHPAAHSCGVCKRIRTRKFYATEGGWMKTAYLCSKCDTPQPLKAK